MYACWETDEPLGPIGDFGVGKVRTYCMYIQASKKLLLIRTLDSIGAVPSHLVLGLLGKEDVKITCGS